MNSYKAISNPKYLQKLISYTQISIKRRAIDKFCRALGKS